LSGVPGRVEAGTPAIDNALTRATMIHLAVVLVGVALTRLVFGSPEGGVSASASAVVLQNIMFLFVQDAPVAAFLAASTICLRLLPARAWQQPARLIEGGLWSRAAMRPDVVCWALAVLTFALTYAGRILMHHGLDFVADEFFPWFQARIFLEGRLFAPIDRDWSGFAMALEPYFAHIDLERGLWGSSYRPGHAALRAVAMWIGDDALLNPVLAAGSVLLIGRIACIAVPQCRFAAALAGLLLLASPQFLGMAVSGFSYTAHLFFCLLWLALFLRADLRGHIAAALVGAFAIGLHQVHVHPLFAAPFLLAHLFGHYGRSRASLATYAIAYSVALVFWVFWIEIATAIQAGDLSVLLGSVRAPAYLRAFEGGTAELNRTWHIVVGPEMSANLLRLAAWLSPALLVLVLMALPRFRQLSLTVRLATAAVVLVIGAHAVLMPVQIHGWGYRYAHPILGNLVLLAVAGFPAGQPEARRAGAVVAVMLLISALVLIPWRAQQIEARIAPRAAALDEIGRLDADVVLLDHTDFWFGVDLLHNDPFLRNRPLVMTLRRLTPAQIEALSHHRVVRIGPDGLAGAGLGQGSWIEPRILPERAGGAQAE